MKLRAILETETMDPDFKEPFLNGMPFDITESTFDRIVRYASGCTDVQQPDVNCHGYSTFIGKPQRVIGIT